METPKVPLSTSTPQQETIEAAISSEPACLINHSIDMLHSRISLAPILLAMLFNEHEDTTQVSNKN